MPAESWKLLLCFCLCQGAGFLGARATMPQVPTWYRTLRKPSFTPPAWVFGPVWGTLYTLLAISFYLVWKGHRLEEVGWPAFLFALQLVLNVAWSVVFFGRRSPGGGVGVIAALLVALAAMLNAFWDRSPAAALLQAPYLLWVGFATLLNVRIWQLNRPGS